MPQSRFVFAALLMLVCFKELMFLTFPPKTRQIWPRFRKFAQDIQTSRAIACLARVLWEMGSKELHIGLMKSQSTQQNQLFITIRHSGWVKWQKGYGAGIRTPKFIRFFASFQIVTKQPLKSALLAPNPISPGPYMMPPL
jgi:hypothetical protein